MKTYTNLFKIIAIGAVIAVALASCGGKKDSGGGGGGTASAPKASGKAAPASDFTYDATPDGAGVVINKYTGNGGKVVIPAEIEGLPVVELRPYSFKGSNYGNEPGDNLTAVVIPASVKKIGEFAFSNCKKLTSVTFLGSGVELDLGVFVSDAELAELVFPDVENALICSQRGSSSFEFCKKLPLAVRSKLNAMGFDKI